MMSKNEFAALIINLVALFRQRLEEALRTQRANVGDDSSFHAGRAMAYAEVLSSMQNQADAFMIPRGDLQLDGFDPVGELGKVGKS